MPAAEKARALELDTAHRPQRSAKSTADNAGVQPRGAFPLGAALCGHVSGSPRGARDVAAGCQVSALTGVRVRWGSRSPGGSRDSLTLPREGACGGRAEPAGGTGREGGGGTGVGEGPEAAHVRGNSAGFG